MNFIELNKTKGETLKSFLYICDSHSIYPTSKEISENNFIENKEICDLNTQCYKVDNIPQAC